MYVVVKGTAALTHDRIAEGIIRGVRRPVQELLLLLLLLCYELLEVLLLQ